MAKLIKIEPVKTYASYDNAVKAFENKFGDVLIDDCHLIYYIAINTDGRFFPVAIGHNAVQAGVHFHFNVVG